jgi:pimeloyl-ACP methyl ester carboxylesterase
MTEQISAQEANRYNVNRVDISEPIPLSEVPEEALQGDILNYLNQALNEQTHNIESITPKDVRSALSEPSMSDANTLDGVHDAADAKMVRGLKKVLSWMQDANTLTRTQKIIEVLETPLDTLHEVREVSQAKEHKNRIMQQIDGAIQKLDTWGQSKGKEFFGKARNAAQAIHDASKNPNGWRNMTKKSDIHYGTADGRVIERPRPVRAKRVELFKAAMEALKKGESAEKFFTEAHQRDEIAYQYLTNQRDITVDFTEYGKQSSRFAEILPPEGIEFTGKTVVIIGGWGTELASFEAAMMEAAMQGFRVIGIAHPDTQFGTTTKKFADAVSTETQPDLHAEFFKQSLKTILKDESFTLIGQSAGGMVVATMLNDAEFAQSVENAVLVSPAGIAKINLINQVYGYISEAKDLLANFDHTPYYSFVSGRKDTTAFDELAKMRINDPDYTDDRSALVKKLKPALTTEEKIDVYKAQQKTYHTKIWNSILKMARRPLDVYKSMHLREGAKLAIICGDEDHAAGTTMDILAMLGRLPETADDTTTITRNSSKIVVNSTPDRNHQAFITQPEKTWGSIIEALGGKKAS